MKNFIIFVVLSLVLVNVTFAKDKLPRRGVLISNFNNVTGNDVKIPPVWGGVSLDGKNNAPIEAKIIKSTDTLWNLVAKNNSKDKYIFTLEFLQFSAEGKQIKKNMFPFSLGPNESKTVKIVPSDRGDDYMVNIVSWKKIDVKKDNKVKKEK